MTFADIKSPVLLMVLGIFAAGWIALYWIMANRVAAAEAAAITLNGQQSAALQAQDSRQSAVLQGINKQLMDISGTLGEIKERSQNQSATLNDLREDIRHLTITIESKE